MGSGIRWLVYALFLSSGATALVYQVAWTRSLTLIFGASHEAISIVLASFMAGLAAGGVVFGRWSERVRRPLRLYGQVEIAVALFALLLVPLLRVVDASYVAVAQRLESTGWALNACRVALAFAVLVLPTFFMGGTLPLLVRFLVRGPADLGERLSGLYAVNTFGAVLGTLAAGFVLLPRLGVFGAQMAAVMGNVCIGSVAILAERRIRWKLSPPPAPSAAGTAGTAGDSVAASGDLPDDVVTAGGVLPVESPRGLKPAARWKPAARGSRSVAHRESGEHEGDRSSGWDLRLAFWGTAVAGMGALALEVLWSRALAVVSGSTVYSFTVMLAAFLIGIALGSWLHAMIPLRRIAAGVQFGAVMLLIGAAAFGVSLLIPRLPELAVRLNLRLHGGLSGVRASTTLLLSFAVMLAPCVLMGVAFPLAGQARVLLKLRPGESVGDVIGLNTLGAIAGSLLAGFVLIPRLGLQGGMMAACLAYAVFGLLVLGAAAARLRPLHAWSVRLGVPTTVAMLVIGGLSAPSWDPRAMAAFQNNKTAAFLDENGRVDMNSWLDVTGLLYYRAGRGANVSVLDVAGYRWLNINGKCVAGDTLEDLHHEYLLGHLPTLLHPNPRTAAVIGLGAGITLGGVAADESIESILVVEIEPAVAAGADLFRDLHDDALSDPRVRVVYQDGRNFLKTTTRRFDVITADPIHPWAQGAAYLYTREYFEMASNRLADGGLMCQWLPLYELSDENLKSVVASFAAGFEHTTMWQAYGDVLLIGSDAPIRVDLAVLANRLKQPRVSRQLARIGLDDPLSLLAEFTMDQPTVERFCRGAVINTDDNLYLEFSSPKSTGSGLGDPHALMIDGYRCSASAVVADSDPLLDSRESLENALRVVQRAKSGAIQAFVAWKTVTAADQIGVWSARADLYRGILADAPGYGPARHRLSDCLAEIAWIHLSEGRPDAARPYLHEALLHDAGNAAANFHAASSLASRGELERAVPLFRAALDRRPRFPEASEGLGLTMAGLGRFEEAAAALCYATDPQPVRAEPGSPPLGGPLGGLAPGGSPLRRGFPKDPQRMTLEVRCAAAFCLARLNRPDEAARYRPSSGPADRVGGVFLSLSDALSRRGLDADAAAALREGLSISEGHAAMSLQLAWLLATSADADVRHAAEALRLAEPLARRGDRARVLDVLAAAQAESGRYEEAIESARKALDLAERTGPAPLADEIRARLALYDQQRPFRRIAPGAP
ncbi:MAG: hypothetical protein C4547_10825 [Phycisphaerales bacterium]|nr:MAG: hypothetical protein C4547_10825 [Phycisphaerales bacterium]